MSVDEIEILEYVDNKLTEKRRIEFEQKMQNDQELQAMVKAMKASILPYDAAFSEQYNEEMPQSVYRFYDEMNQLVSTDHNLSGTKQDSGRFRGLMVAASLCAVFFTMGLVSHNILKPSFNSADEVFSHYEVPSKLFESMVIYQTLYSRKTVEAATQKMADTEALLKQYNEKYDLATVVPDLSSKGYEFRRVQELSYEGKPILQFVYLAETGEPVAICVTPAKGTHPNKNANKQHIVTEFAGMNTLVWEHSNSAYMLISKEPQKKLDALAQIVRSAQT